MIGGKEDMIRRFQYEEETGWSHADRLLLCLDTGSWRTVRPVVDDRKCSYCGLCALYCPVQCMVDKGDHFEPTLAYCKGCGICARECPRKAIAMEKEGDF
jgi:pyruvate ferredoxin oxidoreductase delta subunit